MTIRRPWCLLTLLPIGLALWRLLELLHLQLDLVQATSQLPQWDMAKYGLGGLRLAEALGRMDILSFVHHIHEMSLWPPGIALIETPAFLLFGEGYAVPRVLMIVLFTLLAIAVFWAGHCLGLDRHRGKYHSDRRPDLHDGWAVGLLAVFFLLASPLHHALATLTLLEIPGSLLLALCLASSWRAGPQEAGFWWRTACLFSTLLFFCKYNYGLMWLLPWLTNEAIERSGSTALLMDRIRQFSRKVQWTHPLSVLLILLLGLFLVIRVTGGVRLETEWGSLSVTSIGNPVYALYLLVLVTLAVRPRQNLARFTQLWNRLTPRDQAVARWTLLPIAVWMLFPPHVKNFFGFIENRSSAMPWNDLDTWLYYPKVLGTEFSTLPWTSGLVLTATLALILRWPRLDWSRRLLALALISHLLPTIFHPYKLPRFLMTSTVILWLVTGEAMVRFVHSLTTGRGGSQATRQAGVFLMTLALGILLLRPSLDPERLQREVTSRSVSPEVHEVLDRVTQELDTRPLGQSLVLGTWNLLSPPLLEWHWRQKTARQVPPWKSFCAWRAGSPTTPPLGDTQSGTHLFVLERPDDSSRAYLDETRWHQPIRLRLESDPRWIRETEATFERSGYRLRIYRWLDGSSEDVFSSG